MATAVYNPTLMKSLRKPWQGKYWPAFLLLMLGLIVMTGDGFAQRHAPPGWNAAQKTVGVGIATYGVGYGVCMAVTAGGCAPIAVAGGLLSGIGGVLTAMPTPSVPNAWPQPSDMPDYTDNPNIPNAPAPQVNPPAEGVTINPEFISGLPSSQGTAFACGGASNGCTLDGGGQDQNMERMGHMTHFSRIIQGTKSAGKTVLGHTRIDWRDAATNALATRITQHNLSQRPPVKVSPPSRLIPPIGPIKCACGTRLVRTR